MHDDSCTQPFIETRRPLLAWRLLALLYDFWPALALWMLLSLCFTLGYTITGHDQHQNIAPFSPLQWLLWCLCWMATGLYAVLSWRRGGQTLGMRPWRLRVVNADAITGMPSWRALMLRYAVGTLSLLLMGAGFWWALFDRECLTWHDRASRTRMRREPKRT